MMSVETSTTEEVTQQPAAEQPQAEAAPTQEATEQQQTEQQTEVAEQEDRERDENGRFKPSRLQQRIDELAKKAGENEREAAYWRGVAEAAKPKQEPAPRDDPSKPARDSFATEDEYIEALTDWKLDTRERERIQRSESERLASTWKERTGRAKAEIADFDSVLSSSTAPMSKAMQDTLLESEHGPALAYHLAKNPQEAERIARLSPLAAARELGKLESTLSAPKPAARVTSAPKPPEPIGSGRATQGDPANMSMDEYIAWRKSALKSA